jgi:hypothetical protein
MNWLDLRRRLPVLGRWLGGAIILVYVVSRFLPCSPPVQAGEIEDSYKQFLHAAFAERVQFGSDVAFTFGPWGFLYGGYNPVTSRASVVTWLCLSAVFCWAAWRVARHFSPNGLAAWAWLLSFSAVAGLAIFEAIDVRMSAFVVLLVLLHFFVEDRPVTGAQAALVVVLGLLSLVKFSILIETTMALVVIAAETSLRHRRFAWVLPLFGASLLTFWLAAGQRLDLFAPFLRNCWRVSTGYNEGMMASSPYEPGDVVSFLLVSLWFCGIAGYAGSARGPFAGLAAAAGFLAVLFSTFKQYCVRHDAGHEVFGTLQLLLLSLACLAIAWPIARTKGLWLAAASLLPVPLVFALTASTLSRYSQEGLLAHLSDTLRPRSVLAPLTLLGGAQRLPQAYAAYLADIRETHPTPPIQGSVDTYPGNGAALMAHGLRYVPRPVMQSYKAYTPELAALNASHLRSDRAPASILFQNIAIDGQFPSLQDGPSWPELLTRYDVRAVDWPHVLLQRSAEPRGWRLAPLSEAWPRFEEAVAVPPATNCPIWAQIEVSKTQLGVLVSALYKPPILSLNLSTANGLNLSYRLVSGMARAGFLLSPVIGDSQSFASLAAAGGLAGLSSMQVTSLSVSAGTGFCSSICYKPRVRLRFSRLEFPGQDPNGMEGFSRLKRLAKVIPQVISLRGAFPPEQFYLPEVGSGLRVASDAALQISPPASSRRLALGFDLLKLGGRPWQTSDAVEFRVSAVGQSGELILLWSQLLDPLRGRPDEGHQRVVVDLSQAPSSDLVLETHLQSSPSANRVSCLFTEVSFE